jgi:uncharacterized protein (TIGR02145 family)
VAVAIGGTACASLEIVSDSKIVCVTAAKAAGTYAAIVTTANGASNSDKQYTHVLTKIAPDGTYLSNITPAMCNTAEIFTGTNTGVVTSAREYDVVAGTSTYTNKYYGVAKLPDGRCWMISNYAKASGAGTYMADVSGWTTSTGVSTMYYTDPGVATPLNGIRACIGPGYATTASDAIAYLADSGNNTADSIRNCGYFYNWLGATAGTGTRELVSAIATGSICPSGWHLPTAGNVGTIPNASWGTDKREFTTLSNNLSGILGASSPFRAVLTGYTLPGNGLRSQGDTSYALWSSSAHSIYTITYKFLLGQWRPEQHFTQIHRLFRPLCAECLQSVTKSKRKEQKMTKTTSTKQKLTRILGISNWSRDKLADLLQVSNNSLNSWLSGTSQPHTTHTANIDQIYKELVLPLLCEIETISDKVEKSLLKDRIKHLPDNNICKTD